MKRTHPPYLSARRAGLTGNAAVSVAEWWGEPSRAEQQPLAHLERHFDSQCAIHLEVHVRRDHAGLVQLQRTSRRDVNRAVHDRRVEEVEVDAADRHGQLVSTKIERGRRKVGANQAISPLEVERRVLRKANGRELRNVVGPLCG